MKTQSTAPALSFADRLLELVTAVNPVPERKPEYDPKDPYLVWINQHLSELEKMVRSDDMDPDATLDCLFLQGRFSAVSPKLNSWRRSVRVITRSLHGNMAMGNFTMDHFERLLDWLEWPKPEKTRGLVIPKNFLKKVDLEELIVNSDLSLTERFNLMRRLLDTEPPGYMTGVRLLFHNLFPVSDFQHKAAKLRYCLKLRQGLAPEHVLELLDVLEPVIKAAVEEMAPAQT